MIRIGLICSSGGSPAGAAIQILTQQGYAVEAAVVTDRPCGAEAMAKNLGLPHRRIVYDSRAQFSREAASWIYDDQQMDFACLLYSRLVSSELYGRAPCFNLHPSLLPAFSGLGALEKTCAVAVKFFGATIHRVDESVDGGPIIGQIVSPVPEGADLTIMRRVSFAQKLYLLLVLAERMGSINIHNQHAKSVGGCHLANPALDNPALERAFISYVEREGIAWNK